VKAQRRGKLPLDDARWLPMTDAHGELTRRTGDRSLSARDLTDGLMVGRVRCMRRRLRPGSERARELVSHAFWALHRLDSWSDALLVVPRVQAGPLVASVRGFVFYVWKPDFEKLWPTAVTPSERPADPLQPPSRGRGRPKTHDWHSIDAEIARRCIDPKTGRVTVPKNESKLAADVLQWLTDQDIGQPAESEMREAARRVCAALRNAQK